MTSRSAVRPAKAASARAVASVVKLPLQTESSEDKPAARRRKSATQAIAANAVELSPQERQCYVAEAAYFIAERRGFCSGSELDDWLQAEAQIERLLQGHTEH